MWCHQPPTYSHSYVALTSAAGTPTKRANQATFFIFSLVMCNHWYSFYSYFIVLIMQHVFTFYHILIAWCVLIICPFISFYSLSVCHSSMHALFLCHLSIVICCFLLLLCIVSYSVLPEHLFRLLSGPSSLAHPLL